MTKSGNHGRHVAAEMGDQELGEAAKALPVYTVPEIADYITNGYWHDQNPASGERSWAKSNRTITYNIDVLSVDYRALAKLAFATWHEVTGLRFVQDKSGGAAPEIDFTAMANGSYESDNVSTGHKITHATINIDPTASSTDINSTLTMTFIHEIGHSLGLGHAGNYNGSGVGDTIYQNDTRQFSVMSYGAQGSYGGASSMDVLTPQMADIYAVQQKYGAPEMRETDTTYGFNASGLTAATGYLYDFSHFVQNPANLAYGWAPSLTIYDTGGTDTLDVSGYFYDQRLDLRGGHWSDVGQFKNNIGIYRTTVIENAVGGTGDDSITGNAVANKLNGNDGDDRLSGLQGNDRLTGAAGADKFVFHAGWNRDTIMDFDNGTDKIDLTSFHLTSFDDVKAHASASASGHDTILNFGHGDVLTVKHLAFVDMDATDFVLT